MKSTRTVLAAAAMLAAASVSHAAGFTLGGLPYFTYGNVNSYSMPISADIYASINGGGSGPGNPYYIPSGPGQIQDLVVIYTGASGTGVTTNVSGFDDAYQSPSGSSPQYASISGTVNVTATDTQKAGIVNNSTNAWDANLLAMKTMLAGGDPVFLFNNNDTNKDQSLGIWARMWITDSAGLVYGRDLYLSNRNQAYGTGGVANGDATLYNGGGVTTPAAATTVNTDYVLSGGEVCSDGTNVVPCSGPHTVSYNHNLGANQVAYAGDVPLLNQWFKDLFVLGDAALAGYSFHMDLKLGCDPAAGFAPDQPSGLICPSVQIDNGYEQLFLTSTNNVPVPEPEILGLVGLGLLGVGLSRRRRAV